MWWSRRSRHTGHVGSSVVPEGGRRGGRRDSGGEVDDRWGRACAAAGRGNRGDGQTPFCNRLETVDPLESPEFSTCSDVGVGDRFISFLDSGFPVESWPVPPAPSWPPYGRPLFDGMPDNTGWLFSSNRGRLSISMFLTRTSLQRICTVCGWTKVRGKWKTDKLPVHAPDWARQKCYHLWLQAAEGLIVAVQ